MVPEEASLVFAAVVVVGPFVADQAGLAGRHHGD